MTFLARDGVEIEALVTDRYLESLLAGHAPTGPDQRIRAALDEGVRIAAETLGRGLPRFHPSFRFEERLAGRLADLATTLRMPAAAGAEGVLIPLGGLDPIVDLIDVDDAFDGVYDDPDPRRAGRPLLLGGAITSAALSLAGVAWVAWRRSHPSASPMARAVRAVNAGRPRID